MRFATKSSLAAATAVSGLLLAAPAFAALPVQFGPRDVRSVAYVAKSENKNEVHYGVALDERCMPAGPSPVYGYWQMREHGPSAVEPILDREQRAYGIASQVVSGNTVKVRLRALPDREIVVETSRSGEACAARAVSSIDGRPARLANVYVKLGFPFRVKYLLVQGVALEAGEALRERVDMK
jgi:hypothetical protein